MVRDLMVWVLERGGRPVPILDRNQVRNLLGGRKGGGRGGLGGSAGQAPGSPWGSVGTQMYIPQNGPHDAPIIWNVHNWG